MNGSETCSGLPVKRYEAEGLASEFKSGFDIIYSVSESHITPWGKVQEFLYVVLQQRHC